MRLSPLDIKKQEFTRTLRGYDPEEVQAFLDMLAGQWEELLAEQRRTEDKVREVKTKMEHYERVEEALQEALKTARESSKQAIENAKQEAVLLVKKAVGEAEDLNRDALRQRDQLTHELHELVDRRDKIVVRLRAFLMSEAELLAHFEERTVERIIPQEPEAHDAEPEAADEAPPEPLEEAPVGETALAVVSLETEEEVLEEVAVEEPEAVEEASKIEVEVIKETPPARIDVEPMAEKAQEPVARHIPVEEALEAASVETKEDKPPSFFREGVPEHFSNEEEPLSFKFFEANEAESDVAKFLREDEDLIQFAPDEETTRKREHAPSRSDDRSPSDGSRVVRLDASSPPSPSDPTAEDSGIASSDEIEKIRRILSDLD